MAAASLKNDNSIVGSGCSGTFSKTSGWSTYLTPPNTYSPNAWITYSNSSSVYCDWTFSSITGLGGGVKVLVAVHFLTSNNWLTTVPWQILDSNGTTVLASGTINQKQQLGHFTYDSKPWEWLQAVTPSGTSLTVRILSNGGAGDATICDAAYIQLSTDAFVPATIASGNLSSSSVWINGTIPSNGTRAVIQHAVTVDTNTTIGTSGATGTTAITILGNNAASSATFTGQGGSLTIADGVTLVCRGDLVIDARDSAREANYFPLRIGTGTTGGAVFEFDASQATTPLSQNYVIRPTAGSQPNSAIRMRGISGNPAILRSNASGGNGRISLGGFLNQLNQIDAQWFTWLRIGDGSNVAYDSQITGSGNVLSLLNGKFDACGRVMQGGTLASDAIVRFNDLEFVNSVGSILNVRLNATNNITGAGVREVLRCYFDKQFGDNTSNTGNLCQGFTFQHCIFNDDFVSASGYPFASFDQCVIRKSSRSSSVDTSISNSISNTYMLADTTTFNPHFLATAADRNTTIDGLIFELTDTTDTANDGDGIIVSGTGAVRRHTVRNCLVLPRPAGGSLKASCNLVNPLEGVNGLLASIDNNTYCGSSAYEYAIQVNETNRTVTGAIPLFRSNLYWDVTARGNHFNTVPFVTPNDNILTASGATNNCAWNATTYINAGKTSNGTFYGVPTTSASGTPGANDVNVNPQFVDITRNFARFATTYNQSASVTNTINILKVSPATRIPALLDWVRAGFAPTNSALRNASHTGATIGAVAWVAAGGFPLVSGGPLTNPLIRS